MPENSFRTDQNRSLKMGALKNSTDEEKKIGLALVIAMKKRGIKNKDFAKDLGIMPSQLSFWRTTGKLQSCNLSVIIKKLGFSHGEFFALGE